MKDYETARINNLVEELALVLPNSKVNAETAVKSDIRRHNANQSR
jgi:hypothetical protein